MFLSRLPKNLILLLPKLFILKTGRLVKINKIDGMILAGDFNFPGIIWKKSESDDRIVPWNNDHKEPTRTFIKTVNDSGLYQNINFKTFIKSLKPDTLDLVFTDRLCSEVVQDKFLGNPIGGHIGISWKYGISLNINKDSNSENVNRLMIKETMYETFKKMFITYDNFCKYTAELKVCLENETKNVVNICKIQYFEL